MVDYGLKNKVALITGMNNPYRIGAATALAFAREGAKLVLIYKKTPRPFDENKTDRNDVDRYYAANAGSADTVERKLKETGADYILLESDISDEDAVKEIYIYDSVFGEQTGKISHRASHKSLRRTCLIKFKFVEVYESIASTLFGKKH